MSLPTASGGGGNQILPGTGDGASQTVYDFALKGWWGMALADWAYPSGNDGTAHSNGVHGIYDFRTGNLTTDGVVTFNGGGNNYFAGTLSTGGALTVGNGGPGTIHLNGSTVYDTGSYLHLGATNTVADGNLYASGFLYNSSDRTLKTNIEPLALEDTLNKVLDLQGVSFDWKKDGTHAVGLIAQDVEKVYPELVATDKATGLKSVAYGNLVAPLIEAVKAQQKEIDELKAEVAALKAKD